MDHVKHSTVFHDAVSSKGSLARLVMVSAGQCCPDYSAQEITQDYLSRLQSAEPEVQSFISVASESACAAARALDDRIASDGADSLGPLAAVASRHQGVPFQAANSGTVTSCSGACIHPKC